MTWVASVALSIWAKYPLAKEFYEGLPDQPPDRCFIVSAASRGHAKFVGSWRDQQSGLVINHQLIRFREFEMLLRQRQPRTHFWLRRVYNIVGPWIAKTIRFRWQADLMFTFLLPLELVAIILVRWASLDIDHRAHTAMNLGELTNSKKRADSGKPPALSQDCFRN